MNVRLGLRSNSETHPRAWHSIKFLDPRESGAVIPILHVNGFKISERTIFGCMDDKELVSLFSGYGYQVCIVEDLDDIDNKLSSSLEWALSEILQIQTAARSGKPITKPRWPLIVLRTPKVRVHRFTQHCKRDVLTNGLCNDRGGPGPRKSMGRS